MTPCELEVLLHHYTTHAIHDRVDAPAVKAAVRFWLAEGILQASSDPYPVGDHGLVITERGECLLKEILSTPLPVALWKVVRS